MMKAVERILVLLGVSFLVNQLNAYPTLERARELFPLNEKGRLGVLLTRDEIDSFCRELINGGTTEQKLEMESYLISAITTSSFNVDDRTNTVNQGGVEFRANYVGCSERSLLAGMSLYKTNVVQCEALAMYIGAIKHLEIPKELLAPIPVKSYWGRRGPSGEIIIVPDEKLKVEGSEIWMGVADPDAVAERKRRDRIINPIKEANRAIDTFRDKCFTYLSEAIVACYETLPRSEFDSFTNRMANLSQATKYERMRLFSGLELLCDEEDKVKTPEPDIEIECPDF